VWEGLTCAISSRPKAGCRVQGMQACMQAGIETALAQRDQRTASRSGVRPLEGSRVQGPGSTHWRPACSASPARPKTASAPITCGRRGTVQTVTRHCPLEGTWYMVHGTGRCGTVQTVTRHCPHLSGHPTPCTLYPAPCALHPVPSAVTPSSLYLAWGWPCTTPICSSGAPDLARASGGEIAFGWRAEARTPPTVPPPARDDCDPDDVASFAPWGYWDPDDWDYSGDDSDGQTTLTAWGHLLLLRWQP